MSILSQPLKLGSLTLKNRIIMAPLTRQRAGDERLPNDLMAEYYSQRATAGLILTEATSIEPMGVGYPRTPGIWSDEQVTGWKKITKAVHDKGGVIFLQLWHVGRISDPMYLNGATPVAPSAIAAKGHVSQVRPEKAFVTPRALEVHEIETIIQNYRRAAENAKRAGFDGVEIHGANGYLLDQFLQDSTNKRTDQYGGSIENRARFYLAAVDAAVSVFGADRVGAHISPRGDAHDMGDSNPLATFGYLMEQLKQRKIAFVCAREHEAVTSIGAKLKQIFGGVYIANEKFTKETAESIIQRGDADAVAFGVPYIANPDLAKRLVEGLPLNPPDVSTFYADSAKGYTDYSFST